MIDLHTHSILSDGELLPAELARRFEERGFKAIAITDHVDLSNIKNVVSSIVDFARSWPRKRIKVIPGVELTHLPVEQFKSAVAYCRDNGIRLVIAHGSTLVEPVVEGSARAAILAGVDILAHPGLVSDEDVKLAAKKGVFLELSARKGHCLGNGHVARLAVKHGALLCINSDSHSPSDIPTPGFLKEVGSGAGLSSTEIAGIYKNINSLLVKIS